MTKELGSVAVRINNGRVTSGNTLTAEVKRLLRGESPGDSAWSQREEPTKSGRRASWTVVFWFVR